MKNFQLHRANERGSANHGWLDTKFSFSFAEYYNPSRMGFGALRVINDDTIMPKGGFPTHPHKNMEIVTIVTKGSVEHKDSTGAEGVTKAGEIQYMSAGSGVYHSEYNPSNTETLELFQIWIHPETTGGTPTYQKREFTNLDKKNSWVTLISKKKEGESMAIKQDAKIKIAEIKNGKDLVLEKVKESHGRLLFIIEGSVSIDNIKLEKRDEIQIIDDKKHKIVAESASRILLFEVPLG